MAELIDQPNGIHIHQRTQVDDSYNYLGAFLVLAAATMISYYYYDTKVWITNTMNRTNIAFYDFRLDNACRRCMLRFSTWGFVPHGVVDLSHGAIYILVCMT